MSRAWLALAAVIVVGQLPLSGHHSFAAHYFEEQRVSIEGEVVSFEYRNPHAWVHVNAPDSGGEMRKYGAEWTNPRRLGEQGIKVDTIKPGDHVIVTGSPGRKPEEHRLHDEQHERGEPRDRQREPVVLIRPIRRNRRRQTDTSCQ